LLSVLQDIFSPPPSFLSFILGFFSFPNGRNFFFPMVSRPTVLFVRQPLVTRFSFFFFCPNSLFCPCGGGSPLRKEEVLFSAKGFFPFGFFPGVIFEWHVFCCLRPPLQVSEATQDIPSSGNVFPLSLRFLFCTVPPTFFFPIGPGRAFLFEKKNSGIFSPLRGLPFFLWCFFFFFF